MIWSGFYLTPDAPFHQDVVSEWTRYTTHYSTSQDLLNNSDIIVVWNIANVQQYLKEWKGPVVSVCHGKSAWFDSVDQSRATHFVAVSEEAAGTPTFYNRPVKILHAGVSLDRITPSGDKYQCRTNLSLPKDKKLIGFVGRYSPEKNPLHVARVVAALGEDYHAVYHGHNPWGQEEFMQQVALITENRYSFLFPNNHTGDVYGALDCLIVASPAEGGPLVTMEAWCVGCPVVTTPVGIALELKGPHTHTVPFDSTLQKWKEVVHRVTSETTSLRDGLRCLQYQRFFSAAGAAKRWEDFLLTTLL